MTPILMVDLKSQYLRLKPEIDAAVRRVLETTAFIQGNEVFEFEQNLSQYTGSKNVISCGNGTDALTAALLSSDVGPGDEVVTTPFTFIATVEAIARVGATPVLTDVLEDTFMLDVSQLEAVLTTKTKAIIPVHLFGQCADMDSILKIAKSHNIKVIEDACQAIGAEYTFADGRRGHAGAMGSVGCLSFFPSKNLGCFGDGGALMTRDEELAARLRSICRHGSTERYHHNLVGLNSRLDTLQAAVLNVKLQHLREFIAARKKAATYYRSALSDINWIALPEENPQSAHTYHQFTIRVKDGRRDTLRSHLADKGIPTAIHYPVPAHLQPAYAFLNHRAGDFPVAERLCGEALSLPMHTELTEEQLDYICLTIKNFPL